MTDWPQPGATPQATGMVLSTMTALRGLSNPTTSVIVSTVWPSANLAIFVPVRMFKPWTVCKMSAGVGTGTSGNFDIGIYDATGNRLVSSGAQSHGTAFTEVIANVTDTEIGPGLVYLAMSVDSTVAMICVPPTGSSPVPLQKVRLCGCLEAASSYVLPATVTFAAASTATVIPVVSAYMLPF